LTFRPAGRAGALVTVLALAAAAGCQLPPIDDAEVLEHAANELACVISWTTDESASARVEFGEGDEPRWVVDGDAVGTEHRVTVIGMRPGRAYTLWAVSTTAGGEILRSSPLAFETGPTPFADLVTEVTALDAAAMEPGWTLTNVAVRGVNYPATAVIFDAEGFPVWYHQLGGGDALVDVEVSWIEGSRVLIGGSVAAGSEPTEVDLGGEVRWQGPVQPPGDQLLTPGQMHHSFGRLPWGDHLALRYDGKDSEIYDVIEQLTVDGEVVWSWSGIDHLPGDITVYPWGNAALVDEERGVAYYNARMADRLFQLDRDDGEVLWALGQDGDFAPDPDADFPWFAGAHAPELQDGGGVLLYDNGGAERGFTRVVEYALDEDAMTSRIVWEYPGELAADPWYCAAMGDADRLPGGNTLITAGSLFADNSRTRIFEVTPDGERVWEMWLSGADDGELAGAYMAERIPVLVEEL
jgi:hypothetical protein